MSDLSSKNNLFDGSQKCHYIDWFRVIAILLVFFSHNEFIFSPVNWVIKNKETTIFFMPFNAFNAIMLMPILFFLSGASTWFSLNKRNIRQYIAERLRRIGIPIIFGFFILIPPMTYFESMQKGGYRGTFVEFYTQRYFKAFEFRFTTKIFDDYCKHLWFLCVLLIFSVASICFFNFLKKSTGKKFISVIATICEKPGLILIMVMPMIIADIALKPAFPYMVDWGDFFYWWCLFINGFIVQSDQRFRNILNRNALTSLITGLLCFAGILTLFVMGYAMKWYDSPEYSTGYVLFAIMRSLMAWSLILFLIDFGSRYMNFRNAFIKYFSEASLQFYILHQTWIVVIGFYVVRMNLSWPLKFLMVTVSSFIVTILVYEYLVKRIGILRILMGMKPKIKQKDEEHIRITAI